MLFQLPEEIRSLLDFFDDVLGADIPFQRVTDVYAEEFEGIRQG